MKKALTVLIALVALLAVSCNLDSTEGIYGSIQNAMPQDENAITNLVGSWKDADGKSHYVFNTAKGVAIDNNLEVKFSGVDAKAVDGEGNILVQDQEGWKLWVRETETFEDFAVDSSIAAEGVKVYKTARFRDSAYDVILRNGDKFTLYYTDDLKSLRGPSKTVWKVKEIGVYESTGSSQVYPTLVGHGAWILRGKEGYTVPEAERLIYLVDGTSINYFRDSKAESQIPTYLYSNGDRNYYVFDSKLYNNNDEVKIAPAEGEKEEKSLGISDFFFTVNTTTSTITAVPRNYENNLKIFQITSGQSDIKFFETDINKKEVLGIFQTPIADEFNVVLTGEPGKTVTTKKN